MIRCKIWILFSGSDSRLKLWDVESGCNTLVNFETMRLQTNKPLQLATSQDSSLVFAPCMATVKVHPSTYTFEFVSVCTQLACKI